MKAVIISKPGKPEVLQIQEKDIPKPRAHEVLIKVKAAGINRPDIIQRKGFYPAPPDAPADIPGLEVSGTITAKGPDVEQWQIGDEVCALVSGGGYAEFVCAPAVQCLPIPEGVSLIDAASLPETFFTVWNNVFDIANFEPGETVLIHGGSSGIGVTAIQMVTAMGGKAMVTAGSAEKCSICESLGASEAINYNEEDFEEKVMEYTDGNGVDIILDMIGGDYGTKNINILKPKGRLVMINAMKGKIAEIDLMRVMKNQLTVTGSTLRPKSIDYKGKIAQNLLKHIWPLFGKKIKPVVYKTYPLEKASEAHELMESSKHIGKILLQTSETA